jgi:hypothetical protein
MGINAAISQRHSRDYNYAVQLKAQFQPENQKTIRPSIQWTPADALIVQQVATAMGAAYLLLLLFLLRRVYRYNCDVYPRDIQKWESLFMCQRCGKITDMAVPQAAVSTGS